MSDSETADLPSDATISRILRDTVIAIHKSGNTDDLTVKRVRVRAEQELGLPAGFLKTNSQWKQKSHDQIHEAVDKYCGEDPAPEPAPVKAPKPKATPKATPKKSKAANDSPRGTKRKAQAPPKTQKKRKTIVSSDVGSEDELPAIELSVSDPDSEPPKNPARRQKKVVADSSEDEGEAIPNNAMSRVDLQDEAGSAKPALETKGDVSESEMSSLIDDPPVKKKRQKKAPSENRSKAKEPKAKPKAKASTSKGAKDDDPDQAEIKRLQGWLVKCGIRKVWSKELATYDTPKEKIKHLKGMLKDAGMDGKFSNEKAARIKEQREFAKDLEEIQEGEKLWGQVDEPTGGGRPTRRAAARAPRNVVLEPSSEDDDGSPEKDKAERGSDNDIRGEGIGRVGDDNSEDDSE